MLPKKGLNKKLHATEKNALLENNISIVFYQVRMHQIHLFCTSNEIGITAKHMLAGKVIDFTTYSSVRTSYQSVVSQTLHGMQ